MARAGRTPEPRWVSASELAEHAFCPRAWYYRGHGGESLRTEDSIRDLAAGARFHADRLTSVGRRDRWAGAAQAVALLSAALVGLGLFLLTLGR